MGELRGHPLRVPIKVLLVQAWWNLSDPKAEPLLRNDLRVRRFPAAGLAGRTPDRNRLWRFDARAAPAARDELSKRGLAERLLAEVDGRFRARELVMRPGAIVDATRIPSAVSARNRRRDGRPVHRDADRAARAKRGPTSGYELHAAVGEDSGIVRRSVRNAGVISRPPHGGRRPMTRASRAPGWGRGASRR